MEMDCNLKTLGPTFQVVFACLKVIDIYGRGLFSLCELKGLCHEIFSDSVANKLALK